jgi:hypothetical protein
MELLGDVGLMEPHFGLIGDNVSVGTRELHSLRQTFYRFRNRYVRTW